MISRFRIEAEHQLKEILEDQLSIAAARVISVLRDFGDFKHQPDGEWECTHEVVSGGDSTGYKGRIVMKFHPNGENDDAA